MKKFIIAVIIAACLALCAVVWPQDEVVEETPKPTQTTAVNTSEVPVVAPKEKAEVLPQTEKENTELPQPELPSEAVAESEPTSPETPAIPEVQFIPEPVPTENPVASEAQPTPGPTPTPQPTPEPIPAQMVVDPQPDNMVYVEGFGWLESQGEGTVIHDDMMYENGNKVGIMGSSE